MALIEKLNLINLPEEEKEKALEKFLVSLSLVSEEDLRNVLSYLLTQGITITKAREIKVLSNSKDEISKKISILGEIHETDIYHQDPLLLNKNVIDIYKKIKYCIQIGKAYKKADGTYEPFLFSESLWQQEISEVKNFGEDSISNSLEDNLVTVATVVEEPIMDSFNSFNASTKPETEPVDEEAKTTNFADIRQQLEAQLKELDALKAGNEVISFGDFEPETYEMRRAA